MNNQQKKDFIKQHKETLEEIFNDRRESLKDDIFSKAESLTEEELRLRIKMVDEITYWQYIVNQLDKKSQNRENYC